MEGFGAGVSWEFTALLPRDAKVEAARAQARSVDLDIAWQEWQVAQAAKLQTLRVVSVEQQLQVAKESEKGLENNLAAVTQAVKLGDMTALDQAAAEAAFQQSRLARLSLEQEESRQRLALNQALGLPPDTPVKLQPHIALPGWSTLPTEPLIVEELEKRRLDLLALKWGYDSQEARLRAAILSQFPKITLGFVEARDTGNVVTAGFAITVDLPIFDRNQGQIALERATRQQLFDEYSSRLFTATAEVGRALADMASTKQQIHAAEAFLANLHSLVHLYNTAVLEGNADILSYYTARNTLATQQLELLKLKQTLAELGIALEIAAGRYFPGYDFPPSSPQQGPHGQGGP